MMVAGINPRTPPPSMHRTVTRFPKDGGGVEIGASVVAGGVWSLAMALSESIREQDSWVSDLHWLYHGYI